jgi:hypothetical protein
MSGAFPQISSTTFKRFWDEENWQNRELDESSPSKCWLEVEREVEFRSPTLVTGRTLLCGGNEQEIL